MSNTLTLTIPAGTTKFAVAYACQTVTGSGASQTTFIFQDVIEAATLDGTSFSEICRTTLHLERTIGITAGPGTPAEAYFLSGASSSFSLAMSAGTDRVAVEGYAYTSASPTGANSV